MDDTRLNCIQRNVIEIVFRVIRVTQAARRYAIGYGEDRGEGRGQGGRGEAFKIPYKNAGRSPFGSLSLFLAVNIAQALLSRNCNK